MELVQPKEWRLVRFDKDYGADVTVKCGACGASFDRTTPPLTHVVAICRSCGARNVLHTDFDDMADRAWHPA